ncbi:MAG TPA: LL-diaminopimelate aminotransferase [Verrucomicrobiae bacterium]|nr:LL-diaminopimelate aminotransferase [Verrucomicrobiae bacterium]
MAFLNDNFLKLKAGYLFPEIGRRVKVFCEANPEAAKQLIRCGIGDVTEPLPPAVISAMHKAVDEMASRETFHGYGPEQGYEWLRAAIAKNDFRDRGIEIADDEIFVSDGSKCDCGSILDILGAKNKIAISDPVYPVYVDTNVMAGHTGDANEAGAYGKLIYLPCKPANNFIPEPPKKHVDVIYLCSPNNPTGAAATREQLEAWVKYALENKSVILFDAAYEAYITDENLPHSIYEIPGARECAIEFRSFSKNGGFTGTRCAFTVMPKTLMAQTKSGESKMLHPLWARRQTTKFNGVSYLVQRGAEALYSQEGKSQVRALIEFYLGNAKILRDGAQKVFPKVFGGVNAPYLWVSTQKNVTSWQAFDKMLNEANVVITPGSGFGSRGEGYFRISAFNSRANAGEVARRLLALKW